MNKSEFLIVYIVILIEIKILIDQNLRSCSENFLNIKIHYENNMIKCHYQYHRFKLCVAHGKKRKRQRRWHRYYLSRFFALSNDIAGWFESSDFESFIRCLWCIISAILSWFLCHTYIAINIARCAVQSLKHDWDRFLPREQAIYTC